MDGLSDREILEAKALGILFDILVLQHASRGRIVARKFLASFDSLVVTEAGELTVVKGGVTTGDANGPSRVRKMVKGALFAVVTGGALAIAAFGGVAASNAVIPNGATPELRETYQNYVDLRRALGQSPLPPDPEAMFIDDNLVQVQGAGKEAIDDLVESAKKLAGGARGILKFEDENYVEELEKRVTEDQNMVLLKRVIREYDQLKADNDYWYAEEPGLIGKLWRAINAKDNATYMKELKDLEIKEKELLKKLGENREYSQIIRQVRLWEIENDPDAKAREVELRQIQNYEPGPDREAERDQAFKDQLEAAVIAQLVDAKNIPFTKSGSTYAVAIKNVVREVTPQVYARCKEGKKDGKTCSSLSETIELYREIADEYFTREVNIGPIIEVQDIAIRTRILLGTYNSTIKYVFGLNASHPTLDVLELELENAITTMLLTGWKDYGYWAAYGVSISIPTLYGALIATYGYKTLTAPGLTGGPTPALEIEDGDMPEKPSSDFQDEIVVLDKSGNKHFVQLSTVINLFFFNHKEDKEIIGRNPANFKKVFQKFVYVMYACYSNPKHVSSKRVPFPFAFSPVYNARTKQVRFNNKKAALVFRNMLLMILKTTEDAKKLKPLFVYDAFSIFVKFAVDPYLSPTERNKRQIRSYIKENYSQQIAGPASDVMGRDLDMIGSWVNKNTVDPEGETVGERLGNMEVYLYDEKMSTPLFTKKGENAFVEFFGDRKLAEKFDPEQQNKELVDYLLNLAEVARLKVEAPKNLLT